MYKIHQKLICIMLVMLSSSALISACGSCKEDRKSLPSTNDPAGNNNENKKKDLPHSPTGKNTAEITDESSKKEKECETNQVKIELQKHIKNEILATEISYNQSIKKLHNLFLIPLSNKNKQTKKWASDLTQVLNPLIILSDNLQAELENAKDASGVIGNKELGVIFKKHAPDLSHFRAFATSYERIIEQLKNLQQNATFKKFLDFQHANPLLNQLDLNDLLIMPIQRLPRYPLLLKELLKHISKEDDTYAVLSEALKQIEEVAATVNETMPVPKPIIKKDKPETK